MKILLVEDDIGISRMITRGLQDAGYSVEVASDGAVGLELTRQNVYSLILLDLMLPHVDGWHICESLRADGSQTPVLMLTARDTVDDRVKGLDLGADDYLPKPFAFPELLARVRALLRRDKVHREQIVHVADLEINTAQRRVTRAGTEIGLSYREYELLVALASRESQVLSREVILERVWLDQESVSNTVDVYIRMLRKKIDDGHELKLIHTVWGVGYTLRASAGPEKTG